MKIYEFPYSKVPQNAKILIYGAGTVGQTYLHQLSLTKYCHVVCMIDKKYSMYQSLPVRVLDCETAIKEKFDYIVIANASEEIAGEIVSLLDSYHIPKDKIVYERKCIEPTRTVRGDENIIINSYLDRVAFSKPNSYPIAIHLEGGYGDYICRKNIVEEVSEWDENVLIDLYVGKGKLEFAQKLFSDIKNINNIIDEDVVYYATKDKYIAAFRFTAFLIVDYCNDVLLNELPVAFYKILSTVKKAYEMYGLDEGGIQFAVHYARCIKDNLNCYTAYNRYGFNVFDNKTEIPLLKAKESEFNKMNLGQYITVNYGWDRNQKNIPSKVWPVDYLKELTKLISKQFSGINIVQIGLQDSPLIDGCIHVIDKDIEIIKYVLLHSKLHIDCEGGMVHLATQLGTKCAVLFGPTPKEYYGYDCNINIDAGVCSNCYWFVNDCISCYRKLEQPECMYKLLPEYVMECISGELNKICRGSFPNAGFLEEK